MKTFLNHLKISTIVGVSLYGIFFLTVSVFGKSFLPYNTDFKFFSAAMLFTYVLYFANNYTASFVEKVFKLDWKKPIKLIIVGLIASVVVSFICGFILTILSALIYGATIPEIEGWLFTESHSVLLERTVWISLVVTIIFYFVDFYKSTRDKEVESKEVIIQKVISSNEALKAQIGPHFLFNSLNVLSGLVDENPDKAQDFIADLSKVYRYVLEQNAKDLIPIQEELAFAKTYINLIQTRFENGLSFDLDESLYQSDYQIIPLTLQLLLENCIKHNAVSKNKPLTIQIFKDEKYLVVQNNLNPKRKLEVGTGTGLNNIQEKYKQIATQNLEIEKTANQFIVRIPLLGNKIIKSETMQNYTEAEYLEAKERVKSIRGFYWNLAAYLIVNPYLTFLDMNQDGSYDWAYWPLLGWGIGLIFNAIHAFGWFNTRNWEERKMNEILEKRRQERERFNN